MKNIFLSCLLIFLIKSLSIAQITATDYTLNDCAGNPHHLFAELDEGKVMVISFVMPCLSCISPTIASSDDVANFEISHPGRVIYIISDDNGTTPCSTLSSWVSTNGISNAITVSNTALNMSQYDGNGIGMPKIVVLGGAAHKVYFNENNDQNSHQLNEAINEALGTASINCIENINPDINLYPNPASKSVTLEYNFDYTEEFSIVLYNLIGEKLITVIPEKQFEVKYITQINTEMFSNGIYFIKLNSKTFSKVIQFAISQ